MTSNPASTGPSNSDLNSWIEHLKKCDYIKDADVKSLCNRAKEILQEESNVQHVQSPVTVSKNVEPMLKNIVVDLR